ncbi:MAG: ATP-dependent helicase HrpB, partial [Desulfatitalea sp.]|nr:ATP-dependent helicase HrpB [Desulfatitalea sp.]
HRLQWREQVAWDKAHQCVTAELRLTLGALTLERAPLPDPAGSSVMSAMIVGIRAHGIHVLPWTRALRTFQARVMLLHRVAAETDWPDLSDAALTRDLEAWLAPWLEGITSIKALARLDLAAALHGRLAWRRQQLLDTWAPTHITVPSGSRRPIDYSADTPVLAVRLQEMFGAVETPAIAGGRLRLQLHLLSPAGRPAQITQDLAGFWRNSYADVKKELKGRYPKHDWPDDPLTAPPTARAKSRGGSAAPAG